MKVESNLLKDCLSVLNVEYNWLTLEQLENILLEAQQQGIKIPSTIEGIISLYLTILEKEGF